MDSPEFGQQEKLFPFEIVDSADALDPLIEVSMDDPELGSVMNKVKSLLPDNPALIDITTAINQLYPINPAVTAEILKLRNSPEQQPKRLGNYFQPTEEVPYQAVCVHKSLLAQAVASTFHIESGITSFFFYGQIKDGMNDGRGGMHAVNTYQDSKGDKWAADAHKGLYEPYDQYFQRFQNPNIIFEDIKVFAPNK